ncbi:MAG: ChaN family lipoprotein [Guyparkeria sp.]|uniref:ChaN family lipoprotein n=1 Tax=Guyparkeria sp. TaxID=2035736 RepID=UPI00397A6109
MLKPQVVTKRMAWSASLLLTMCFSACAESIEVGSWWNGQGDSIAESKALSRLNGASVILLGEVHDSPETHRRQLELLKALDGPVVLGLEQLDRAGADRVDRLNGETFASGRARAEAGDFDVEGWGWEHYGPLFDWAWQNRTPLWPLNLSREKAMAVAMAEGDDWRESLDPTTSAWIERWAPDLSLPDDEQGELVEVLERSHCREIPDAMARRMVRAQVARDLVMAEAIMASREAYPSYRVVAVMGNQHARLDRGVGYWLDRVVEGNPDVLSVGMLPIDQMDVKPGAGDAYDLILIVPPISRDDPCATERDQRSAP